MWLGMNDSSPDSYLSKDRHQEPEPTDRYMPLTSRRNKFTCNSERAGVDDQLFFASILQENKRRNPLDKLSNSTAQPNDEFLLKYQTAGSIHSFEETIAILQTKDLKPM
ncbi:hypothetical protein PGT21_031649 [Puccinia graminis f. sp. tritici]|uniref:Uncharacterized protein n=1 Tax=Puccinia graminis f. sp. tritici TaxID=56615 RepID=A0A5B0PPF8_PUCGR|nr:hypothetical protein PGT21_031649 [Puccinia graminis f. sp. tritici]KAA1133912.1 hypothetical protein PGTUg99_031590 [Puccinia graminis f. sp. tritici]